MRLTRFGRKPLTVNAQRTALQTLLVMADNLDKLDATSLSRSYGMPANDVEGMIQQERFRRAAHR